MKLSIAVLSALAGLSTAEFWVGRILTTPNAICVGMGTCSRPTVRKDTYIIRGDEKEDCKALGKRSVENGFFVDPLCPGNEAGGKPFQLKGGNVCTQPDRTTFYFRVSTTDNQKLDVSFTPGFENIVAFCHKEKKCGDEQRKTCSHVGSSTDVLYEYRCDAANGSSC
ncbi:uncharacterized protein RCC_00787 [Ramularia collo-cygni]|uniref:Uncharacterized protein n=1 Tax=Ramularia collo-cygni TaxID=112498 RepID=A0A2D3UNC8_9PEZI|nr:uncharacterized protein RCC_00787 [Ramularia collo-cygni]CZT14848.1 uncharacterized protein RCC_00787 [Ramularia collo-cygni]